MFNSIIETNWLKELALHGKLYTWSNNQEGPTFEKLDRILVSTEWESAHPLASVSGLGRDLSDHEPLSLSSGVEPPHSNILRFENCWPEREGFQEMVKESWSAPTYCKHDVDKWQEKVRRFRRHVRGWHLNVEGRYKKARKEILILLDELDKKSEITSLSMRAEITPGYIP